MARASWSLRVLLLLVTAALAGCTPASPGSVPGSGRASRAPFDLGDPSGNDTQLVREADTQCSLGLGACRAASLGALDAAREGEGLAAARLPRGFWSLSDADQELVLVDEERVSRRLPPIADETAALDAVALVAAQGHRDPTYQGPAVAWASNWGEGINQVLIDVELMYVDGYLGPGSGNLDCSSPAAPGCWGHRRNILYRWPAIGHGVELQMGSACVPTAGPTGLAGLSCGTVFVETTSTGRPLFTWAAAVRLGA